MSEFHQARFSRSVETVIRSAAHYVRPSSQLRPRTLEAARQHCGDQRAEQKLGGFVLVVLMLAFLGSPAVHYVEAVRCRTAAPTAQEIQNRAIKYGDHPEIGHHWGLTEAFTQLRRMQAGRLGQTVRSIE